MTFYKEWLLGVCLHYTFSHIGWVFLCVCALSWWFCTSRLLTWGSLVWLWKITATQWCSLSDGRATSNICSMSVGNPSQRVQHTNSSPHCSLLSTIVLLSSCKLVDIIQERLSRQGCSVQHKPSFPRNEGTVNPDLQVYYGHLEVNTLLMLAQHPYKTYLLNTPCLTWESNLTWFFPQLSKQAAMTTLTFPLGLKKTQTTLETTN